MMFIHFFPYPKLHTDRLVLKKPNLKDANAFSELRSNTIVNTFLDRPATTSPIEAENIIRNISNNIKQEESLYWTLKLKTSNKLIGTICLWNLQKEKSLAEIGYELHPDYHGHGFMQETIEKVIEFGFTKMKLKVIIAWVKNENKKSIALLLKRNFLPDTNFEFVDKESAKGYDIYFLTKEK